MKLHSSVMASLILRLGIVITTLSLFGCDKNRPQPEPTANTGPEVTAAEGASAVIPYPDEWPTDHLIGQWNGPEGTFLRIGGERGQYVVTVQNLDGQGHYNGRAVGGQIQFERNGVTETLRPTKGEETGMKWLSDKTNCLTVHAGEGYCRD